MLLNIHILAQEYLISFSLHLNTFKFFKFYLLRYRDIRTLNYIIHFIERINCDNKITLVNLWELSINSWYLWDNFTKKKSWREHILSGKNIGVDSLSDYCTLELDLVKEYNTQDGFGTWCVNVDLSNHIKNQVCKFSSLSSYSKHLIMLLVIIFIMFN
jgi:hypothetical protein